MCSQHPQTQKGSPFVHVMPVIPDDNYVVCGRGKMNAKHAGNKKFANIIRESLIDYMNANSRIKKIVIVTSVTSRIHDCGLKFITFDSSTQRYKELSSERVHDKVSHAIRDQIKQNEKHCVRRVSTCVTDSTKSHGEERHRLKNNTKSNLYTTINQSSKKRHFCSINRIDEKSDRSGFTLKRQVDKKMANSGPVLPMDKSPSRQKDTFATLNDESEFTKEIVRFPDMICDLGARFEEPRTSIGNGDFLMSKSESTIDAPTINRWSDISVLDEIKSETIDETNISPLSMQSLSPLPVDAETCFEYHDIKRVCDILEQDEIEQNIFHCSWMIQ